MERAVTADTQLLLVGGSSWQGWELLPARGYSAGEDDPVLVEKQSLPCLQSTWRCLNICLQLYLDTVPFANAGRCVCSQAWAGLGAQPVTAAKKQHLFRFYIVPKQPVTARFPHIPGAKHGRDPGPSQPPCGVLPGRSQACRERMDAPGGQGGSRTNFLVLLGVFISQVPTVCSGVRVIFLF